MRSFGKIFLGLGLAVSFAAASPAFAGGMKDVPPASMTFRMVKAADHAAVTKKFRDKMADQIEGVGLWKAHGSDTPEMRIIPMSQGSLVKTKHAATEINIDNIGGPGAEFAFHGKAEKTKFKVLLPVSAHYGLPYKQYAAGNEYQVVVHDKAGKQIYSQTVKSVGYGKNTTSMTRQDYITEHEIELPFDAGKEFKVSFWPTATSKGGFTAGREVTVRLSE